MLPRGTLLVDKYVEIWVCEILQRPCIKGVKTYRPLCHSRGLDLFYSLLDLVKNRLKNIIVLKSAIVIFDMMVKLVRPHLENCIHNDIEIKGLKIIFPI